LKTLQIDGLVIQEAIKIRQIKKISLGDSLVAATALVHGLEIVSRNTVDFSGIHLA
jgi:toxin FitB